MKPQIDFKHVLGELSVNRNDPCEIVRELISNAYDAGAKNIRYAAINSLKAFIFWDDGIGLSRTNKSNNNITPYEAFFSIGKSTKIQGSSIGYKCQGSKLCFASNRVLVISKTEDDEFWFFKIIENPRHNLQQETDITPLNSKRPWDDISNFIGSGNLETSKVLETFNKDFFTDKFKHGFLIIVQGLDVESNDFTNYLVAPENVLNSYIANYIRFYTKHGDTRAITLEQGFSNTHITQIVSKDHTACDFYLFNGIDYKKIDFGFPYLKFNHNPDIKPPSKVAALRHGQFNARYAQSINHANCSYNCILAIDGNRRALDEYNTLSRQKQKNSGVPLYEQRGVLLSVNGVRVCRYNEIFSLQELSEYSSLQESNALSHFILVIDGPFELITNRNGISKSASDIFGNSDFIRKIKSFLDKAKLNNTIFKQLVDRLNKEQQDINLERQMKLLKESKESIRQRERIRLDDELYLSPLPGEEYLVGVLYANLYSKIPCDSDYFKYWHRVLTFSTQGIDSIAMAKGMSLSEDNLIAIEYKYEFSTTNLFNHPLTIVDKIIAWEVNININDKIKDEYKCFGKIKLLEDGTYEIYDIEDDSGSDYPHRKISVICLKDLIKKTFPRVKFSQP